MTTQTLNFKIDAKLKQQFSELAADLGTTTSGLLNILIKRTVDDRAIPFEVKAPKKVLPPVYQKLWIQEQAIELGLLPDDSEEITDKEMEEWRNLYK